MCFQCTPSCIVRDFNEDILVISTDSILKMSTQEGYTQHVKMLTGDSGTLIDHIYTLKVEGDTQSDV